MCRHWAVKLQRTQGLSISSWPAVAHPVRATLDWGRADGWAHPSPQPYHPTESHQVFPGKRANLTQGLRGKEKTHAKHLSISQIACCGAAKLTSFSHPGGPMETHESKKCWIQLFLPSKRPPQIGSESSKFLFRRKTDCKVWSQWTGRHNRARLNLRITPSHLSNWSGASHCPLGLHPSQRVTMEAGKPTARQDEHSPSREGHTPAGFHSRAVLQCRDGS